MSIKRAYDDDAKEARRRDILDAAEALYAADADQLPGVARIAAAAGLAKGTVYLYFSTKEEIFAAVLLKGWNRVLDALEYCFGDTRPAPEAIAAFLARFVALLDETPGLMRLDALGHGVLESRMTSDALLDFKTAFRGRLEQAGRLLERELALPAGRGFQLLTRSHALARGIWQSFGTPPDDAGACTGIATPAFAGELHEALTEYWRGALLTTGRD